MQIPFLHQQIILETEKMRDMHRSMMIHHTAIPSNEMEAFLQQLRKIYAIGLELGNQNSMQLMNEVFLASQKIADQVEAIDQNIIQTPVQAQAFEKTQSVTPSNSESLSNLPPDSSNAIQNPVSPTTTQETVASTVTQLPSLSDSRQQEFIAQGNTVAKKFAVPSTVAGKMAGEDHHKRLSDNVKPPVSDINSAIGINEKFQFINQLFQGDSQKYSQFVNELNNCPSADAAKKTIQQVADSNHWENIPMAKNFIDVVERRFA